MFSKQFNALALLVAALWMSILIMWFYIPPAPVIDLGGSTVSPRVVRAGGTIMVNRNLEAIREQSVTVTRTMIKGDCRVSCEILDLAGGELTLSKGIFRNVSREHVIPLTATPGKWRLVFATRWEDRFGRKLVEPLEDLEIEVIK